MTNRDEKSKDYYIRKRYCPSQKENVIVKVFFDPTQNEVCTNREICEANGGCTNQYLNNI